MTDAADDGADAPGVRDDERRRAAEMFVRGRNEETAVDDIDGLISAFVRVELPGGATLFEDGDEGDSVYVITRGRLRVLGEEDHVVAELGPGETVGELALLTGAPRHGSVVAIRDSVLHRLSRPDFDHFCLAHPRAMHTLLVTLATRMTAPPRRGRHRARPKNLVVVPTARSEHAREFADELASFLDEYVAARVVTPDSVDQAVGHGASGSDHSSRLGVSTSDHLAALEQAHDHLVFIADSSSTEWSKRCVRQADLILLVGDAGTEVGHGAVESWMRSAEDLRLQADEHLVLVEAVDGRTPTGTSPWLRDRDVEMVHHVCLGRRSHFARLGRFLIGEPCGLVLSGGAARALAHIGVIRALREANIPVDVVAATSAGALIGAEFAMGWSPELIEANNARIFGGPRRKLLDFTPPFTSLIGSSRFNAALDSVFGDVCFEDLWIQLMCTTTDLTAARPQTHRRGRLRQYVRASCSLPMVMPPVTLSGHLLADGGIMNNVPVDPLLEVTNVGTLVVVNVTNPFYTADEDYNYDDSLPFARVLNSRINPFAEKLVAPGILDVLMRSLEIGSKSLEPGQIAKSDVYVRPDVSDYGYTDVEHQEDIVRAGYVAAVQQLDAWDRPTIPFT